jgi:hypothetical protein
MPGVVEHGLFIGIAKQALVGKGLSVVEIHPGRQKTARAKRPQPGRPKKKQQLRKRGRP